MASWKNATALDRAADPARRPAPRRDRRAAGLRRDAPCPERCGPSSSATGRCAGTSPAGRPFRSEVLSHPSVNVSVESGTEPRFGFAAAGRPGARRGHPPVHRRPGRRRPGDRGEVPARRLRRVHRRAARPATASSRSGPSSGLGRTACWPPSSPRTTTTTAPPSSTPPWRRARRSRPRLPRPAGPARRDDRRPLAGARRPGRRARRAERAVPAAAVRGVRRA